MQQIIDFIALNWSAHGGAIVGVIITLLLTGYIGNSLATFLVLAIGKLKGGPFWVVVKWFHGIIEQVDPALPANPAQAKLIAAAPVGAEKLVVESVNTEEAKS